MQAGRQAERVGRCLGACQGQWRVQRARASRSLTQVMLLPLDSAACAAPAPATDVAAAHLSTCLLFGADICLAVLAPTHQHHCEARGPPSSLLQLLHLGSNLLADVFCYLLAVDECCCPGCCWCGRCGSSSDDGATAAALADVLLPLPPAGQLVLLHVLERCHDDSVFWSEPETSSSRSAAAEKKCKTRTRAAADRRKQ